MSKISEPISFEETKYLIGRKGVDGCVIFETCNYGSLISRIVKYFNNNLEDLQVIKVFNTHPYFREVRQDRLKRLYKMHISNLERAIE